MSFNKRSRTSNVIKNSATSLLNKSVVLLLSLICRKVFIYDIGVEYLGINGLFADVLMLLSIAELGIGVAVNASLYKPIANNDTEKLSDLINYYRVLYNPILKAHEIEVK